MTRLFACGLAALALAASGRGPALPAPAAAAAHAPRATDPEASGQVPVFRSGVDLVRLDMRVTDGDGRPITDIRPDEVEVAEGGAIRPILLFQRVQRPRGTYAEMAQQTIAAEVSTNQGAPRGQVYVLVFDQSHILPGNEQRARIAVDRFLETSMHPGDRVALYALPGPGPQVEFTSDVARVRRSLISVRGSGEETGVGALATMRTYEAYEVARGNQAIVGRIMDRYTQERVPTDVSSGRRPGQEDPASVRRQVLEDARMLVARADGESRRFLAALADVVRGLRQVDGRKAVVVFSEGFEVDNVTSELQDVAAAAAQSFSVIYAMHIGSAAVTERDQSERGGEALMERRGRTQSLGSLAGETDGALITDADQQLNQALASIAEASQDYYLVGFAPSRPGTDRAAYHRVDVRVKRPGARVSARRGYAVGPTPTPADRRATVEAALRAPFSQQGLKVEYTTYVLRGSSSDVQRVLVSLAADLPVAEASEAKQADVLFAVRDVADGRVVASGSDTMPLPERTRPGETMGLGLYRVQFEVPAGIYLMRAVVREPGGLLGSADRRFQVRGLRGPGVTASDLVLGSAEVRGLPVRTRAYTADALTAMLEVYGASPAHLADATVNVELLPIGNAAAVTTARAELAEPTAAGRGYVRAARAIVPLSGVAPGEYLVRAVVRDGAETVAELLRDVRIVAGAPPQPATTSPVPVDPRYVLRGEVAQRYLASMRARLSAGPLGPAATAVSEGRWTAVEGAIPAGEAATPDARALRGVAALARGELQSAAQSLRAALAPGDAADAGLAFMLGWALAGAGDDRAAVGAWRTALLADKTLLPAYLALADAYVRLGNPALARQVLISGLQALPGSPELLEKLSRLGPT